MTNKTGNLNSATSSTATFDHVDPFRRKEHDMTNKVGLVELIQTELKTFRATATVQGEPDFRELAVSIVRVFRDFIETEIKMPDPYDREQPGKGQGWE